VLRVDEIVANGSLASLRHPRSLGGAECAVNGAV
jgi:hypothetical protein